MSLLLFAATSGAQLVAAQSDWPPGVQALLERFDSTSASGRALDVKGRYCGRSDAQGRRGEAVLLVRQKQRERERGAGNRREPETGAEREESGLGSGVLAARAGGRSSDQRRSQTSSRLSQGSKGGRRGATGVVAACGCS